MRIQHNIPAMNAYRNFRTNSSMLSKNLEKLSSGYRINRAGDDAAGLAISEKMRAQISGLTTAQSNAKDGISLVQTAEGALTEVHDMLNRMVTLAEQSANGTYGDDLDRVQLQKEVDQLRDEINRIADSANFNGIKLLDGSMDATNAVEATSTTKLHTNIGKMTALASKDIAPTQVGSTSGKYVEGTIGEFTIRHRAGNEVDKGGFYVDLNNYTVSDEGSLTIAIGSINGTVGTISFAIGSKEVASGNTISAAQLATKAVMAARTAYKAALIAANSSVVTATTATSSVDAIVKIDGKDYTVSAEGNRIKFESVTGKGDSVAREVRILGALSASQAYTYTKASGSSVATKATGSKTGTIIKFSFDGTASAAVDSEKAAFVGASESSNIASFTFEVGVSQELGTITGVISSGTSNAVLPSSGASNAKISAYNATDGLTVAGTTGASYAASTVKGWEVTLTGAVTNTSGSTDTSDTFKVAIKLEDLDEAGAIINKKLGSASASGVVTSFNFDALTVNKAIQGIADHITDLVATDGEFTIGTFTVATKDSANNVPTTGVDKVMFGGSTPASTTKLDFTFKVGEGSSDPTITVSLSVKELRAAAGSGHSSDVEFTAGVVRDALKTKVQNMFGKQVEDEAVDLSKDKMTVTVGSDIVKALGSGFVLKAAVWGSDGSGAIVATNGTFTASQLTTNPMLAIGTGSGDLRVASNATSFTVEVWTAASTASKAKKVGTFTITPGTPPAASGSSTTTKFYNASATLGSAFGDTYVSSSQDNSIKVQAGFVTEKKALGSGDYNTSTEVIKPGSDKAGTRLASTILNTGSASATKTLANGSKISMPAVFSGKIKDGTVMKIGETNYIFAVGSQSKLQQDDDGNVLIDLKDIENDATNGLSGDELETALERLTLAAKDNAMFGVGYDKNAKEFTLTENADYYGDGTGKVLLNTEAKIAAQIAFGNVKAADQSVETIETEAVQAEDLTLQIGDTSDSYNQLKVTIKDMHTDAIGIGTIDISNQTGAQEAVDKIKSAINYVSDVRGSLGATQNRLEHTINNLSVMVENITDAESTIRDTDIAAEMMSYTKNSILNQAAQAMLAQANQLPQGVLQLLG